MRNPKSGKLLTLAAAALFAGAACVLSGPVLAAPSTTVPGNQQECEARGGWWMKNGCAYKSCRHDNGGTYSPGSIVITRTKKYYMCDGVTGTWTRFD